MIIGLGYLLAAVTAIGLWMAGYSNVCNEPICAQLALGFGGRSWLLWGAFYYSIAGMLTMRYKKSLVVGGILLLGVLFHSMLILLSYKSMHSFCSVCLLFYGFELLLIIGYILNKENEGSVSSIIALGPARAFVVIVLALLIVNQVPITIGNTQPEKAYAGVMYSKSSNKPDQLQKTEPASINVSKVTASTNVSNVEVKTEEIQEKADMSAQSEVIVTSEDERQSILNLKERPALLFSWWCPHCDDALKNIAKLSPEKRPYLVVVYLQGNNDDMYIKQKLKSNRLVGSSYYVYSQMSPPVQDVPTIIWYDNGFQKSSDFEVQALNNLMSKFNLKPKWAYNGDKCNNNFVPLVTPGLIKYQPIKNPSAVIAWLKAKGSMLAEGKYLDALDAAGKKYDVSPLLLLAVTGQEQSFVPVTWPEADEMIKNPFNVYGSWQLYAPGFDKSAMIAAQTINRLSVNCPVLMNPIEWIDSPANPNCRYAEDTNWWKGVNKFFSELSNMNFLSQYLRN